MRVVEIVREEIVRHGKAYTMPIAERRALCTLAKRAIRHNVNPRVAVSRQLTLCQGK